MAHLIRPARPEDGPAILPIYAPHVESTLVSFETTVPGLEEMDRRRQNAHAWLVAEVEGRVQGYCYAGPFKERAGYRWTVETSVYLAESARGRGLGRSLYEHLLAWLREAGFYQAYAGIALPNEASVRLHERLGFARAGVFPKAGFKMGRWVDVGWWHLQLLPGDPT